MRIVFAVIFVVCILATVCYADSGSQSVQSISGDFGRAWLSNFMSQNQKPADNSDDGLWSWGNAPKGSMLLNGKLVPTPNTTAANGNWLGDTYTDPYTGKPVYDNSPVFPELDYGSNLPAVFNSKDPWA